MLLYDIGADGSGQNAPALMLSVPDGGTVQTAISSGEAFADETPAASCTFYALDTSGQRTRWELTAPVTQALSLYTYSYTLSATYDATGSEVRLTDLEGTQHAYRVTALETLAADAVLPMLSGDWDLTFFTCTFGGQSRIAVRCRVGDEQCSAASSRRFDGKEAMICRQKQSSPRMRL